MTKGVFITLEGGEGTGKSTQIKLLSEAISAQGFDVITTREPGGTPEAEKIRSFLVQRDGGDWDPVSELLLFNAARREHLTKKIWPAIDQGTWVVSDRYADLTLAFQGYGHGVSLAMIEKLHEITAESTQPDLTIMLDIPVEEGLARSGKQLTTTDDADEATEDRFELLGLEFHERVRNGFLEIAKKYPKRCAVIDARPDIESVHQAIMQEITTRFLNTDEAVNGH